MKAMTSVVAVVVIGAAGLAAAQNPTSTDPLLSPEAQRGLTTFSQSCAGCHGPRAEGGQGPALTGQFRHGSSDQDLARNIRQGFLAGGMPSSDNFSETQIKELIAFIRSRKFSGAQAWDELSTELPLDPLPTGVVRTDVESFRVQKVAQIDRPYGIAPLPDGRFLVTQTTGELRFVDTAGHVSDPIIGTPKGPTPEDSFRRNMLDVAPHPDYARNGWIYLTWTHQEPGIKGRLGGRLTLSRGRIKNGRWVDNQDLLTTPNYTATCARIVFDGRGHVFYGVIDPDQPEDATKESPPAQDLSSPIGKILRLNEDGTVPADNPFVRRKDAFPYIWSYGHRAEHGLAFDADGSLWESEEGPRGGDELNLILPGRNYGWPIITWGHRYDEAAVHGHPIQRGMEQPVYNWSPAIALSAARLYAGSAFPKWKGDLLVGTLKHQTLLRIKLQNKRVALVEEILFNIGRMRDVQIGADGLIYIITDGGELLRLTPAQKRQQRAALHGLVINSRPS